MMTDTLHVVHARAAGLDVHKMQITASVRLCTPGAGEPQIETRTFEALASGLDAMVAWLRERCVDAAVMEGTGIYWLAPFEALEAAGIPATLVNARQVKQLKGRKTDVADSVWLARVCQFGLATASHVPPKTFREVRVLTRYRRTLVGQRSRVRNRVQKVLDRSGVRVGGVLSDVFGANGRRILDGLAQGLDPDAILASLSHHVGHKLERLGDALRLELSAVERLVLCDLLREHDALQERIQRLDRDIDSGLEPWSEYITLLQTIPGIDRPSACAILAEIGPDLEVFGGAERLAAWAGLCPGNDRSGQAPLGPCSKGEQDAARGARRVRSWRGTHPRVPVPRLPQGADGPARLQARHRGHRAQAAAGALRRVARRPALPRPRGRLRRAHGPAQRPALAPHASAPWDDRARARRGHLKPSPAWSAVDTGPQTGAARSPTPHPVAASTTVRRCNFPSARWRSSQSWETFTANFHGKPDSAPSRREHDRAPMQLPVGTVALVSILGNFHGKLSRQTFTANFHGKIYFTLSGSVV